MDKYIKPIIKKIEIRPEEGITCYNTVPPSTPSTGVGSGSIDWDAIWAWLRELFGR